MRKSKRKTKLAIAALLVIVVVVLTFPADRPQVHIWRLERLSAGLDHRTTKGRLSGFPFALPPENTAQEPSIALKVFRAEASRVANAFGDSATAAGLHAGGVGQLEAGHARRASATFALAAALAPADANMWNDLGVGLLATSNDEKDPTQLIDALGAVDHALRLDPNRREAIFTRAQILEEMGIHPESAAAWRRYVELDTSSPWSGEAVAHATRLDSRTRAQEWRKAFARLRRTAIDGDRVTVLAIVRSFPQDARASAETLLLDEWANAISKGDVSGAASSLELVSLVGDALVQVNGETMLRDVVIAVHNERDRAALMALASAQQQYVAARRLYSDVHRNIAAALPLFQSASEIFRSRRNPMKNAADFYIACSFFDSNRGADALQMLRKLEASVPASHIALHAFIQWEISVVFSRMGRLNEALDGQSRSTRLFESLGEDSNANVIGAMAAGTQSLLGRRLEAWRMQIEIFRRMSRSGDPRDFQRAIDQAARTEALSGKWENAFSLMTIAIEPALNRNPRVYVSSLIWHALAAYRLRIVGVIAPDLALARHAASRIQDPVLRSRGRDDIKFCEAVAVETSNRARSIGLFNEYIANARRGQNLFLLSEALLERGRVNVRAGRQDAAINDFRDSLLLSRNNSRTMEAAQIRDAYFRTSDSAARELADALVRKGRHAEALAIIDAERSRPYKVDAPAALWPERGTLIIEYVVLPSHVLIFAVTETGVSVRRIDVPENTLESRIDEFLRRLDDDDDDDDDGHAAVAISELLVAPIANDIARANHLVIVPERAIARLPFAALRGSEGHTLVDDAVIIVAPSASVALQPSPTERPIPRRVAAIGNPAFDTTRFPLLQQLPAAEKEARSVGAMYQQATILVGLSATRAAVSSALHSSDVVHLGTHALLLSADPARSHLILAPSVGDPGVLYLGDIERTTLGSTRLVVLAGCDTAAPPDVRRNVDTLALAFVAAGASNVVGTLWRVEDSATAEFSGLLHAEILRGASAAEALRRAQLAMRRSRSASFRRTGAWAGFQLYGTGK